MVHYNENIIHGGQVKELSLHDAGEHYLLLEGLVSVIRMAVQCPDWYTGDSSKLVVVLDLLEAILPSEYQLKGGIESEEAWFRKNNERLMKENKKQ